MNVDLKPIDEALAPLRALLAAAGVRFRIVGGLAVVHHGYARTTEDIDVLVPADAPTKLAAVAAAHGFALEGDARLRHAATGARVDLLIAGRTAPRPGAAPYPDPDVVAGATDDPSVIGLPGLVELKLRANRHQDRADVVALLKRLDDGPYLALEAAIDRSLRPALARLRDDALEELRFADE